MTGWPQRLADLVRQGEPVAVVTVVATRGSAPREAGAKMLVEGSGAFHGTVGGGHLEHLVLVDAAACLRERRPRLLRYPLGAKVGQCCGGVVDVMVEVLNVEPLLFVFGAGHVGQALASVLEGTEFRVALIDERDEWIGSPRIPEAVARHACPWDEAMGSIVWSAERTFVAIMTHRHDVDQAIVEAVVQRPARYIGMIGSETKWQRLRERLADRGRTQEELARVKCPIGIDIGGKAPRDVAISVAAELLRVHHGRG